MTHCARFKLCKDEDTGRLYWWGAEDGWKDATEIGENGTLIISAEHFAVGTVLTMEEPFEEPDNDFDEDAAEWDDMPNVWTKPGPFASLRDMVHTECPCGCGSKEVCAAHRARVKANDDAIPF